MTVEAGPAAMETFELYRRELTGYSYRMLGSGFEAEDAVQETLLRAWRAADGFEGRSSVRSWLYRIATNVCLDMLGSRQRRARPMELGPSYPPVESSADSLLPEDRWVSPMADARVIAEDGDPATIAAARETVRLAFITALQHLPARQRSMLILADVLRWQATEIAELLDTTVPAVNSGLQRARATLASVRGEEPRPPSQRDQQLLLGRFVDAFERYDVGMIVSLLHDDAVQSMPPLAMWFQGTDDIAAFLSGPGHACRGSRLVPTEANGCPAFGQYRVDPDGGHAPWALQVIEISGDRISGLHSFLDVEQLFPDFGLPSHLPV
jgi:RNA polymerase sigma-70 factor (ECF subfamily)